MMAASGRGASASLSLTSGVAIPVTGIGFLYQIILRPAFKENRAIVKCFYAKPQAIAEAPRLSQLCFDSTCFNIWTLTNEGLLPNSSNKTNVLLPLLLRNACGT
ncbi:hypothetical protein Ancab_009995 [Ancistrocladus abbreviatus]